MYSAGVKDLGAYGGEWAGLDLLQSYEVALWAACQKALETAEALQSDLERLDDEHMGRSRVHSQSRNQSRACLRNCLRNHFEKLFWKLF